MQERARFEQDLQTLTDDLSAKAEEEVIIANERSACLNGEGTDGTESGTEDTR